VLACSEGYTPGAVLPLGGLLPLNPGFLLFASLDPASPFFVQFSGALDAAGAASPTLFVPSLPFLAGWPLYFAGFTLDAGVVAERELTNWIRVTLAL
jgi:hypothetical protein